MAANRSTRKVWARCSSPTGALPPASQPGGGLGLGLHSCSQIVKAHGGSLAVTSSAAAGARFVARLPARAGLRPRKLLI
jgi:signal transduction histidine kinase